MNKRLSHHQRYAVILLISFASVVILLFMGPIPQDPAYHNFADQRRIAGINHFWNVISNIPFLLIGIVGLLRYSRLSYAENALAYLVMCVGVFLVGLGSAYYHYGPSNETLLWDRLPMTITFMAFIALLLNERVLRKQRPYMLWVLVLLGAGSAFYWAWTESIGRGDLRLYVLIQFLPILLMPFILLMYPQRYLSNRFLIWSFVFYFAAKILEYFDGYVFTVTGSLSGHALKHLVAAVAAFCILYAIPVRKLFR